MFYFFFFSSRRRHTRCSRDWSSDVCSSDLAALVVGTPATLPVSVATGLARVRSVVIGPRASAATFQPAVTIDTGLAGVHEGGTAFRMDDVPLPLRPALEAPHGALVTVRALRERLHT